MQQNKNQLRIKNIDLTNLKLNTTWAGQAIRISFQEVSLNLKGHNNNN